MRISSILVLMGKMLCIGMFCSCEKTASIAPPPLDTDSTFTMPLAISTTPGYFQFPVFDIRNTRRETLHIGVFKRPVQVDASHTNILNQDDIVWRWHGGLDKTPPNIVHHEDGQTLKNQEVMPLAPLECMAKKYQTHTYYWAAWGWDTQGNYLLWVDPANQFVWVDPRAGVHYQQSQLLQDANEDQLINSNEYITLEVTLENFDKQYGEEVQVTFSHEGVTEFPKAVRFGTFDQGKTRTASLSFTTPKHVTYGDTLLLLADITDQQCYFHRDTIQVPINGRRVCLDKVVLNEYPQDIHWDIWGPACIPQISAPDIFYQIKEKESSTLLKSSAPAWNATQKDILWQEDSTFCIVHTNRTHLLEFYDDDTNVSNACIIGGTRDDFMGEVIFTPKDLYPDFPKILVLRNKKIQATLYLEWE